MRGRIAFQSTSCEMTEGGGSVCDSLGSPRRPRTALTALNRFRSTRVAREPVRMLPVRDQLRSPQARRAMQ